MLMVLTGLSSCTKEEFSETDTTNSIDTITQIDTIEEDTIDQSPSKTELITGSYSISLTVYNGDTLDLNAQYGDQTFVIKEDGTGDQILYITYDSITMEFNKPLEWKFESNEQVWSMRTKDLDDNGNPLEDWGDWIPFNILKLTSNEFWYGLGDFYVVHMEKQQVK